MDFSDASEKIPSDTTGNRSGDLLNHYATPDPHNPTYYAIYNSNYIIYRKIGI
jgi:hypothetical protein